MNILILSTGSVSAYLSHKMAFMLKEEGHEVKHYMTKAAGEMMMYSKGSLSTAKAVYLLRLTLMFHSANPSILAISLLTTH